MTHGLGVSRGAGRWVLYALDEATKRGFRILVGRDPPP